MSEFYTTKFLIWRKYAKEWNLDAKSWKLKMRKFRDLYNLSSAAWPQILNFEIEDIPHFVHGT